MKRIIEAAFARPRTVVAALLLLVLWGAMVAIEIPKEAEPDVQLPIVYVSVRLEGIAPEDAERLLVKPLEREFKSLEGLERMRAIAAEGHASLVLTFEAEVDIERALREVRERTDRAKAELPPEAEEPEVDEVNLSLFPVLVVTLSGDVPERTLLRLARELEDRIEQLPEVLDVVIAGEREERVEILIHPEKIEGYGLRVDEVLSLVRRNNQLIAAGSWDVGKGRFAVEVPGLVEDLADLRAMPIKVEAGTVVALGDIATIRRTFTDPEGFARVDGKPAIALEVKKRIGRNILATTEAVRAVVEAQRKSWPPGIEVGYSQDKSRVIATMLDDLGNNVITAVILTMIVTVAALGVRSSMLVGLAVPVAFLASFVVLQAMGLTLNIVVLFSLILAVGMLVDGATVVVEYADRKMAEGLSPREAFRRAAQRMAWPVISSTGTVLAAFLPLLFWPGIIGEFMRYLPITLVATLGAALLMALVFVPVIGSFLGRPPGEDLAAKRNVAATESGDLDSVGGVIGLYVRLMRFALARPLALVGLAALVLVASWWAYASFGRGVELFPEVEPDRAQIMVHARGDLSIFERDRLVREVEARVLGTPGVERVYARTALDWRGGEQVDEDVIGILLLELADWRSRRPAREIVAELRERVRDLAGIRVEVRTPRAGPPVGKPVQLELASRDPERLAAATAAARAAFERQAGLIEIGDSRPVPSIQWRIEVDRELAARLGADVATIGSTVRLVTNGLVIATYRPDDTDREVDIVARYPAEMRGLDELDRLVVVTPAGPVPIGHMVSREPAPRVAEIERVDGERAFTVAADVQPGVLADTVVGELARWLAREGDPAVRYRFKGEEEEQAKASAFLGRAFVIALFLIAIILLTQFDSVYQTLLILSAVLFSTVGVLLGLLVVDQPFGIIMSGIGVIALAGIVVSNNIVLIDTYNELRGRGLPVEEAILRTGAQRLRPVLLTTFNGVLGLLPLVFKLNVDVIGREITIGGPSADWWQQLSLAIAWGLTFATLITLVLTPCLLLLGARVGSWWRGIRGGRTEAVREAEVVPLPRAAE
ncbi:MAG: efflux RND transporter permease subunit [Geminicoccaceae bacterium]|nr:efflux RND transporter permease subunit [Geminicoccaceae bacterium]